MFKALKMMLLYAFLCFIMPFVKLYEMCAEYKSFTVKIDVLNHLGGK